MKATSVLVLAIALKGGYGQMMMGMPGMGMGMGMGMGGMGMGGMGGNWNLFGKAWDSFGKSFKNMAEAFKNMKPMQPWHKGENVCYNEEFRPDPFAEDGSLPAGEYENCRESAFKVICISNIFLNGKQQERIRRYQCCPGFVGVFNDGKKCILP